MLHSDQAMEYADEIDEIIELVRSRLA